MCSQGTNLCDWVIGSMCGFGIGSLWSAKSRKMQHAAASPRPVGLTVFCLCFPGPEATHSGAAVNNDLVDRNGGESARGLFLFVCTAGSSVQRGNQFV